MTRIQETLSNCCLSIRDFGSKSVQWMGKNVSSAKESIVAGSQKVSRAAAPYIAQIKQFAQENKPALVIGAVCLLLGAGLGALFAKLFNRGNATAAAPVPAVVPNPEPAPTVAASSVAAAS